MRRVAVNYGSRVGTWRPPITMKFTRRYDALGTYVARSSHYSSSCFVPRIQKRSHSLYIRSHSSMRRMTAPGPKSQIWHLSHGIVFAQGDQVVYPRLPSVRHHSSPALCSSQANEPAGLPTAVVAGLTRNAPSTSISTQGRSKSVSPTVSIPKPPVKITNSNKVAESKVSPPQAATTAASAELIADEEIDPPFAPLDFKIPDPVFRAAKLAPTDTPESYWSYNLYRGPSDTKVKVHYCKSNHTTERVLQQYFMDEKVIGFDLEWAPDAFRSASPRRNVSLIQIASESRIALFHVALYPKNDEFVSPSLKKIMEDEGVTKVGVCIKGDCTRLRKFLGIDSRGVFELSHLYKLVKYSKTRDFGAINRKTVNLAAQVKEYLRLPLFKGQDVRASDWSQQLGMDQIIYSACDAYAAVQLYAILDHHRKQLDPTPPLPYHAEHNKPIRLADGALLSDTADESPEIEFVDEQTETAVLPEGYLKAHSDEVSIEADPEGDYIPPIATTTTTPPKAPSPPKPPKDHRILAAEDWLVQYRATHQTPKAAPAALRAYRIWHTNPDLDPEALARVLRDPPLQKMTVVNYILEAIRSEKLPFDAGRLQSEVLCLIPKELVASRYKSLARLCELQQAVAGGTSEQQAETTTVPDTP